MDKVKQTEGIKLVLTHSQHKPSNRLQRSDQCR